MSDPSFSTTFPNRNPCFGDLFNSSSACQVPTLQMIDFLNISSPNAYLDAYCLNPPVDSCAFGYCANPDVASPAVRISTYITTIISALLVLYSPDDAQASPHTIVAMGLAASPLSVYLIIYVFRSIYGNQNRLQTVFGKGKWGVISGVFVVAWGTAIYLQRREIWKKHNKKLPLRRMWRKVVDAYPFIQFCTVTQPSAATYGQILALIVAVPPLIQLCLLLPPAICLVR
ncbi:hypothetical protein B0H14DRAFT_2936583 [Mycena olivaceomarginata]|nr:hypothetical protein B0H14DRAFT_2936583 [Mycena olivaceomarginata]